MGYHDTSSILLCFVISFSVKKFEKKEKEICKKNDFLIDLEKECKTHTHKKHDLNNIIIQI